MYRNYKIFSARIYLADNSGKCLNHPLGELILIFSGIVVDSRRMLGYSNIAVKISIVDTETINYTVSISNKRKSKKMLDY